MPNSSQIRKERIQKLYHKFHNSGVFASPIKTVDPILETALTMFPTVTKKTVRSYAKAVLKMLHASRETT